MGRGALGKAWHGTENPDLQCSNQSLPEKKTC